MLAATHAPGKTSMDWGKLVTSDDKKHSLEFKGLEGLKWARIPIEPFDQNCPLDSSSITLKISNIEFFAKAEWYIPVCGISLKRITKILEKSPTPNKKLERLVFRRMEFASKEYSRVKRCAEAIFRVTDPWQQKMFNTLCKVKEEFSNWKKSLKKDQKSLYVPRGNNKVFTLAVCDHERIYAFIRQILGEGSCKTIKEGINLIDNEPIARIKRKKSEKKMFNPSSSANPEAKEEHTMHIKYWYRECEIYRKLDVFKKEGADLEGLLTAIDIIDIKKVNPDPNGIPIERCQIIVKKISKNLLDYLNEGLMKKGEILRMSYLITKAINTFHILLGHCHRDIKPENILIDSSLNIYLMDYGFARLPKSIFDLDMVGSNGYIPPEIIRRTLHPHLFQGPIDSAAWDAWSLGIVLYMVNYSAAPSFFQDLIDSNYRSALIKIRTMTLEPHPSKNSMNSMNEVICGLLNEDPRERLSVFEAHILLTALYQKKSSSVAHKPAP